MKINKKSLRAEGGGSERILSSFENEKLLEVVKMVKEN